jgi:lactoylglutathione lyase
MPDAPVHELRLVLTVEDFEGSVRIYRDVLGMREVPAVSSPGGRVTILEAGRATLELVDAAHAAYIDEVEVGHRSAGHVRIALGVPAVEEQSRRLEDAGLAALAPPTTTPFGSTNARFELPDGLQLTLFG